MFDKIQEACWEALTSQMSAEEVAQAFTDYHGNQLLDEGFYRHLVEEGYTSDYARLLDDDDDEIDYERED